MSTYFVKYKNSRKRFESTGKLIHMKEKRKKALLLTGIYWNDTFQRHQQFALYLQKAGYDVYFIEHIISSRFQIRKIKNILKRYILEDSNITMNQEKNNKPSGIYIFTSECINPHSGLFEVYNNFKIRSLIQDIIYISKDNFFDIVINYLPVRTSLKIVDKIKFNKLIYDCVRDFSNWGEACRNINKLEEKIVNQSDYVFTDSYYLTNKMSRIKKNSVIQFLPVVNEDWVKGCITAKIPYRIRKLGYFGTFGEHVDTDILKYLIEKGYELHFWGKNEKILDSFFINHGYFSDLNVLANSIIRTVDALIIPYKGNMDGVIPTKLMQALFTQLPVYISTFYDSVYLKEYLYVFENKDKLVEMLLLYNKENHKKKIKQLKNILGEQYEENQYKKFKEIINL